MKLNILLCAIIGALLLGGCGEDEGSAEGTSQLPTESGAEAAKREKPEISVPPTPPPERVLTEDLIIGEGKEVGKGDTVEILYVSVTWDGKPYADSWRYRAPPSFILGSGLLAPGFDQGIRGMRVGGRREVLVPISQLRNKVAEERAAFPPRPRDSLVLVVDVLDAD